MSSIQTKKEKKRKGGMKGLNGWSKKKRVLGLRHAGAVHRGGHGTHPQPGRQHLQHQRFERAAHPSQRLRGGHEAGARKRLAEGFATVCRVEPGTVLAAPRPLAIAPAFFYLFYLFFFFFCSSLFSFCGEKKKDVQTIVVALIINQIVYILVSGLLDCLLLFYS